MNAKKAELAGKRVLMVPVLFAIMFVLLQLPSFFENVLFYASGAILSNVFTQHWSLMAINIMVFLLFLVPLSFRKKADWKQKGLFSAFVVSLFIEMYGIPLSIFAAYSYFNPAAIAAQAAERQVVFVADFFGTQLAIDYWSAFGYFLVTIGAIIISLAWWKLYNSKKQFEDSGLYAISRHPQYLGFFFLIWGWTISWPSMLTLAMAVLLTIAYHWASLKEEKLLEKGLGEKFLQYKKSTPMYA